MKICTHCSVSNPDAATFCLDCGYALNATSPTPKTPLNPTLPPRSPLPETLAVHPPTVPDTIVSSLPLPTPPDPPATPPKTAGFTLEQLQNMRQRVRKADIMFVLDCTGSMQGEINAVRDAIASFADAIEAEAVRARVGLIEFRDRLIKQEHRVLQFEGNSFTSNPTLFRQQVAQLKAKGGGDEPESSLDALMLALEQPFDPEANKVIVLITDAPPHVPDRSTPNIETVVERMQAVEVNQLYLVMRTQDPNQQVYLRLLERTRGLAFEIGKGDDFRSRAEDFKQTLMALGKTISSYTR